LPLDIQFAVEVLYCENTRLSRKPGKFAMLGTNEKNSMNYAHSVIIEEGGPVRRMRGCNLRVKERIV
jgi:hypothetical protein